MKYIFSTIFALLFSGGLFAQDCSDYHQFHCQYGDYTYYYSRQSKSALFERGQTSELHIVCYSGEEYYVSICANRKWNNMRFKIMEDNEDRTVLYDNADHDYLEWVSIENEESRNLVVEVITPDPEKPSEVGEKRCVGVVVMFRPMKDKSNSGQMGF